MAHPAVRAGHEEWRCLRGLSTQVRADLPEAEEIEGAPHGGPAEHEEGGRRERSRTTAIHRAAPRSLNTGMSTLPQADDEQECEAGGDGVEGAVVAGPGARARGARGRAGGRCRCAARRTPARGTRPMPARRAAASPAGRTWGARPRRTNRWIRRQARRPAPSSSGRRLRPSVHVHSSPPTPISQSHAPSPARDPATAPGVGTLLRR